MLVLLAIPLRPARAEVLSGTALEVLQVQAYTYIRISQDSGETWAAVPKAEVEVGDAVRVVGASAMGEFNSPALGRTFPAIWFGSLDLPRGTPEAATADPQGPGTAGAVGAGLYHGVDVQGVEPVPRAEGRLGRTVAEVHRKAHRLEGRQVAVRGVVVRVSEGVLGRTWFHLQDGTGTLADASHDLLVSAGETVPTGARVVVRGIVRSDTDIGGGYRYPLLVEATAIEQEARR